MIHYDTVRIEPKYCNTEFLVTPSYSSELNQPWSERALMALCMMVLR